MIQSAREVKRLWPYIKDQKKYLVLAIVTIPLITASQMSLPLLVKYTIDEGIQKNDYSTIQKGCIAFIALVIFEYLIKSLQNIGSSFAVFQMIRVLRDKVISHVMSLSARFHDKSMSGTLVTRATSDFDSLSDSLNMGVLTAVIDLALLTGAITGLFILNSKLALISIFIIPIVTIVVTGFSRALKQTMLNARKKVGILNAFTQECLYGSSAVKVLTAEEEAKEKYHKLNIDYRNAQMKSVAFDAVMFSILDGIAAITIGIALYWAVSGSFGLEGVTAGVMIAFIQYIQNIFEPIKQLGNKIALFQGALTAMDRIFGILDKKSFVEGEDPIYSISGDVSFKNVFFKYDPEATSDTLSNISFELSKGQSLALVGSTGSGKSTVTKILSKLYGGYKGSITIDGKEISEISGDGLRKLISIVPQDIILFNDTIRFNITLGLDTVTEQNMVDACKAVGIHDFIMTLPGGYDFIVAEQGGNLSHGQRQLIAFARALSKNPRLVILDEATSSVDPESENKIQLAIDKILKNRTVIVVAHRLSTIESCDNIVCLERGKVVEQGTHKDLLLKKGQYYQFYNT